MSFAFGFMGTPNAYGILEALNRALEDDDLAQKQFKIQLGTSRGTNEHVSAGRPIGRTGMMAEKHEQTGLPFGCSG